jgi:hypothetical protein
MKHHAERLERIRQLLDAVEAQHSQLQALIANSDRLKAELRAELGGDTAPVGAPSRRSAGAGRNSKTARRNTKSRSNGRK